MVNSKFVKNGSLPVECQIKELTSGTSYSVSSGY